MLYAAPVGDALQELGAAIRFTSSLESRTLEASCILVAVHESCDFELNSHKRFGLAVGITAEEIDALLRLTIPSSFTPTEWAAAEFVLDILNHNEIPDASYLRFEDLLGPRVLVEMVTLVGYYQLLASIFATFGTPG
jgi:4-carboxymuconolactone decarboxylase